MGKPKSFREAVDLIADCLYDGGSAIRNGFYNLTKEQFIEFGYTLLRDGKNILPEIDEATWATWGDRANG